jgi:hypothetical protein
MAEAAWSRALGKVGDKQGGMGRVKLIGFQANSCQALLTHCVFVLVL